MPADQVRRLIEEAKRVERISNPSKRWERYRQWQAKAKAVLEQLGAAHALSWKVEHLGEDIRIMSTFVVGGGSVVSDDVKTQHGIGGDHAMVTNDDRKSVFVIHGRDMAVRKALFDFLRAIGLTPLEWGQLISSTGSGTPYIGEVLDTAFERAQAVVALYTPDDVACLREDLRKANDAKYEKELTGQARPNVIFETGMAMGRHPNRTIIVEVGAIRPYSDISGRHVVRLTNDAASRKELAQRLEACGCDVNTRGNDWLSTGDFSIHVARSNVHRGRAKKS